MRASLGRAYVVLLRIAGRAAAVVVVGGLGLALARSGPDAGALVPGGVQWFSPSSIWNQAVAIDAPLDPDSDAIVNHLRLAAAAHATINTTQYSVPVYRVGPDQPSVRVRLTATNAPSLADVLSAVPIPPDARGAAGSDGAAVVYQPSSDTAWELFRLRKTPAGFVADWGGRTLGVSTHSGYYRDLTDAAGMITERYGWGITAAKLARLGGLITIAELRAGEIDHALAIAVPQPRAGAFAFPAQATDGTSQAPDSVPEGAHFRLDPALDVDKLKAGPITRMLARAAQTYGLVVNNGTSSAVVFVAEDPQTLAVNPYPQIFGALNGSQIAKAFPWNRLQLLDMDLRTMPHPLG